MEPDDLDDKLTAWWLQIAPSRQEELLMADPPPMPWLDASLEAAELAAEDTRGFLDAKRQEMETTRDSGLNPRPD